MLRLRLVGLQLAALMAAASSPVFAQTKETKMPKPKPASVKPLDINSASEEELTAIGIDKPLAKKIVQGRPYRNKLELVSKQILARDQYDKLKDSLVAKQPPKSAK